MSLAWKTEQLIKRSFLRFLQPWISRPQRTPEVLDKTPIKNILVIRPHDQLGDFLLSTPALRAVRDRFPDAVIDIIVRKYCADAMFHHPLIRRILVFHEHIKQWTFPYIVRFWTVLREPRDLAIVLSSESHSVSSDILAILSRTPFVLGSESRIFPGTKRNYCYNLIAPASSPLSHQSQRNVDIVQYIGGFTDDLSEFIFINQEEKDMSKKAYPDHYSESGRVVGLHIGANKPENRWPTEKFCELADMLMKQSNVRIVIFWGPKEWSLADAFRTCLDYGESMMPPSTLRQQAVHFSLCDAVICNDTGIMHLCAAVGTPLVGIFGPTDPGLWKPVGNEFRAVRNPDHKMENVEVEEVYKAVEKILKKQHQFSKSRKGDRK